MDDQPLKIADPGVTRRKSRLPWIIGGVLIVLIAGWWVWHHYTTATAPATAASSASPGGRGGRGGRFGANGPMPVVTATATTGNMPITLNALGTVTPLAAITVRTQIAGQLQKVGFTEGQYVEKGQFLAQVDPRPYQIQLEQAQGTLAHDEALLKNAELDLKRYKTLASQDSIAMQQVDTQAALVRQYEGTVKSDRAAIHTAQLDLIYCHITAPVAGRVGLRQVDPGNYVQTSDTNGVVILTQTKPISVLFTLPEDNLPAVLKRVHSGATLPVTAFDRSQTTKLADGNLANLDNEIDTTTGTVKLRANFANADESLFPNQFVNVRLLVDTLQGTLLIPASGIQRGAPGTYVYVVNPTHKVSVRVVTLGPTDGQNTAITAGLKAGEIVVTDGADRLKDGAPVMLASANPAKGNAAGGTAGQGHHRHRQASGDSGDASGGNNGTQDSGQPKPAAAPPAQ